MWRIVKELIAAILCRCPQCWQPLACQRHWLGGIEGYGNYYCPKCNNVTEKNYKEYEDVYE